MSWTLGLYVVRRFLKVVSSAFLGVFALIVIVDLVELSNRNSDGTASFTDLVWMALLHAPSIALTAAPFTVLLAAMACFAMLARSSELVVTRAAGVSVWALLAPPLIAAVLLGIFTFSVFNPVASAFSGRFEALEGKFFGSTSSQLSVAGDGLWLRQGGPSGQTVIRAGHASGDLERLGEVTVFEFDESGRLTRRLEAQMAVLEERAWRLHDIRRWDFTSRGATALDASAAARETRARQVEELRLPTELTPQRIQESFAAPNTIAFWDLPDFIETLDQSGFSSNRHRLHWHALLSLPVVFSAMLLIGAAFSMRHVRFGGLGFMALGCVIAGFGYFFLSDISQALGASGAVPVVIAAWAPPAAAVLSALALLLHFEDG